ncbi:hypothetical protein ACFC58_42870 [Kitasatospora purpeofusca]|uniref:hypothetical protein n=1 Tax=Kitasatospora purpeofusca TaxID=67352 RepID=UPI0035D6B3D9
MATVAAVAALVTGHPWLLALAAGPAVLLALAATGNDRPSRLDAENSVTPRRCLEGEPITVRITVRHDGRTGRLDPTVALGPGLAGNSIAAGRVRMSAEPENA